MPYMAHAFVDGAYLRKLSLAAEAPLTNPQALCIETISRPSVQSWCWSREQGNQIPLARVNYYDARRDAEDKSEQDAWAQVDLAAYWDAIDLLHDTQLVFGSIRGRETRPRQKKVDTLLAVDMVVGAFTGIFQVALLVAGDADFVPVVDEVRRRGVMVVLAAEERSLSPELRRAADRFVRITATQVEDHQIPAMKGVGNLSFPTQKVAAALAAMGKK